jgi:hypothetical protein
MPSTSNSSRAAPSRFWFRGRWRGRGSGRRSSAARACFHRTRATATCLSVVVAAEPVDVEEARQVLDLGAHFEPVVEVLAHVVADERQHRHRVAAHAGGEADGGGGGFRAHRGAHVDAVRPVEGLVDQRHRLRAAAAEDDRRDLDAVRVLPIGVDGRAVDGRRGEARVGVRGLAAAVGRPIRCRSSRWRGPAAPWSCLPTTRRRRR